MGLSAPELTAPPSCDRLRPETSRDHRTLAPRLGLTAPDLSWTAAGLAVRDRLLARLRDLAPELHPQTTHESHGHGLLATPATQLTGAAPLARAITIANAWAEALELRPDRLLVRGQPDLADTVDLAEWGPVHTDPLPGVSARLFALDRLERAITLAQIDMPEGSNQVEIASFPVEHLLALLLEAGSLPLWLAPEQVRVLPVTGAQLPAAEALIDELRGMDLRVHAPRHDAPLASRIAQAERARVPCVVVLGARELQRDVVSVREAGHIHEEPRAGFLQSVASAAGAPLPLSSRGAQTLQEE